MPIIKQFVKEQCQRRNINATKKHLIKKYCHMEQLIKEQCQYEHN